ncbi:MAG: DNA-binding response regulator [Pseudomonas sp. PGPPP4]|uniref:response regulator transcription factor n=1 Tax=Pseudomonas TaxID=286 RepID=UPI000BD694BB|nr:MULTISPECIES: response regulator transcription factor [Pseudomonas]MCI1007841.1 response regulator transcription factor [Pseudomonas oryzihabitans]OYT85798.1 MAG: DNA-binding response regulator [Pseudomonas sp. PGPPP4]
MHILLVEDDATLADGIRRVLEGHGMQVDLLRNGAEADAWLRTTRFAVVVLDIGLPGGLDGFEVVRRLRQRGSDQPVLLLTARDAIDDRVHGFEVGADDYLVKPFAVPELVARIKALVRRAGGQNSADLTLGVLRLDTAAHQARLGDTALDLSAREWAVLEHLLRQAGKVVSKQQIIDALAPWGSEDLTHNAVEVYVSRLRLKLADSGVGIRTVRGFGYRLEEAAP